MTLFSIAFTHLNLAFSSFNYHLAKIAQISNIASLTLNLFYYNFFIIYVRDDLAFCSLIMFIMEVTHADKIIKHSLANDRFNHVGKFLTAP